ncbi:molybdenum cofactor insertion chaperone PaoD [Brucella sp. NBRC 12953]|uniref:XdhC family protein n=1 Tax=Brucella sp. NBRC 12953 TaxID=3075481 RepID=UPI003096A999
MTVSTHPSHDNNASPSKFPGRTNNFGRDATTGFDAGILPVPAEAFPTDSAVEVLHFAIRAVAAGRKVALCTLVEIRGGSSRSLGAHMAVADDGLYCGYVSGGCTEAAVAAEALQAISTGYDRFVMLGEGSPFFDIVLPCGGGVTVAVHVLRDIRPVRKAVEGLQCRQKTGLSYSPSTQSLSFVSGRADAGWNNETFLTAYRPAVRILLSGRTLEVELIAKVARAAGYDVVRHDAASGQAPDGALIDADTAVALLQHDLELEIPVLDAALHAHPFYLGALGSSRTHEKRMQRLRDLGHSQKVIDRIKAPIGLFARARDVQSLALSVIADIAACRQAARSGG